MPSAVIFYYYLLLRRRHLYFSHLGFWRVSLFTMILGISRGIVDVMLIPQSLYVCIATSWSQREADVLCQKQRCKPTWLHRISFICFCSASAIEWFGIFAWAFFLGTFHERWNLQITVSCLQIHCQQFKWFPFIFERWNFSVH